MVDKVASYSGQKKTFLIDLACVLFLGILVCLFFWPVVTGAAWIPRGGGDLVSLLYPMYRMVAHSFQEGQIPLWNPYLYSGTSLIADNQSGLFYPPNLILFLFKPNFSYAALQNLVLLHFWLAGGGMYIYLRRKPSNLVLGWMPSLIGAVAFMFSGVFIAHIGNLNLIAVLAWFPLIFLAFQTAVNEQHLNRRIRMAVLSGFLLGVATLAGHGQSTFLIAAFLGVYALYEVMAQRKLMPLLVLGVCGVISVAVSAVSLLPALEGVQYTVRAEFFSGTNYSLPGRALIGLFAPDYFGRGIVKFWGMWERVEYGYVGVVTWLLVSLGLSRKNLFYGITAVLFLLLAMGENAPLLPLILRIYPDFPFQVPARFVFLLDFSLAVLAAHGAQRLFDEVLTEARRNYWIAGTLAGVGVLAFWMWSVYQELSPLDPSRTMQVERAVVMFVLFAMVGWVVVNGRLFKKLTAYQATILILLILIVDLFMLGSTLEIEENDPTLGFRLETPALEFLNGDPGIHRIDLATQAWQPSFPQMVQQYSISGVFNPLDLANYSVYRGSLGYRGSPVYNLLGVKYIVGQKNNPPGDTNFIIPVFADDPEVTVYLNTRALPRALVLHNAQVVDGSDEAFDAIHKDTFDPQSFVILERGEALIQEPSPSPIEIHQYDLNESRFRVTTDKPAYFLLSDIYHPHWRASVNGDEQEILVANYALRALYLEPGVNDIHFWFRPIIWQIGSILSMVTWVGLLIFFFVTFSRERQR